MEDATKYIGIDLGTEYCRVAEVVGLPRVRLIASGQEQATRVPTGVSYRKRWVWGWSATQSPEQVAWDLKAQLRDEAQVLVVRNETYTPSDLLREYLRLLRYDLLDRTADSAGGRAALTVPCSFGIAQRETLRSAAENAGFSVCGLINEPEAAVLGYDLERLLVPGTRHKVLVFDVGASATKVSVLEVQVTGRTLGIEFVTHVADAPSFRKVQYDVLARKGALPPEGVPPAIWAPPLTRALARVLANQREVSVDLNGQKLTLSPQEVEDALADWLGEADAAVSRALSQADLQPRNIDLALPIGGPCAMPEVRRAVAHFARVCDPPTTATEEDICARGAAKYALLCTEGGGQFDFRAAETPAIGVHLASGAFDPILQINHEAGADDLRIYVASDPSTEVVDLIFAEGLCRVAASNRTLAGEPVQVPLNAEDNFIVVRAAREGNGGLQVQVQYGKQSREYRFSLV